MFPKKKKKLKLNARDSRHTSIKFSKEVSDGLNSGPIQYRQLYELLGGPPFFFFSIGSLQFVIDCCNFFMSTTCHGVSAF